MKFIRFITIAAVAASMLPLTAQTTRKLSATKASEYGLIYTLPLTEIDVTVEAQSTVSKPGEFYQYAGKYLQLQSPVTHPSEVWELKSVTLTTRPVADQNERYLVQFKAGSVPYMMINSQDFPVSINTEKTFEKPAVELPVSRAAEPTILDTPVATQAVTEEMLRSTSTAKRAELAAARIIELRQSRSDVMTGNADAMPSDGEAMKIAIDNINAQEQALTAMFAGTAQTATEVETFSYRPDSLDTQRVVIARLSPGKGIVSADDLSGAPIYLKIKVTERGKLPINEKGLVKTFPKGGLAYRIPGIARVSVEFEGREVAAADMPLAQAGVVFGLDPGLFTDRRTPAAAVFDPVSGAIVELSTVSAPEAAK